MDQTDFSLSFTVDADAHQMFRAINDVRGWWAGEIEGRTDALGAEFTYLQRGIHRSTQRVTELVPGQRVVWRVTDASLEFVPQKTEWDGTDIVFELSPKGGQTEVRFTHRGLVPRFQCYQACARGWAFYLNDGLRPLIAAGQATPARRAP